MSAKKKFPVRTALTGAVEAWLIEHGGAPPLTTVHGTGKKAFEVTSPQYPDPLPSLREAMKAYPCKGHGDRKPTVCAEAKKLARAN